MKSMIVACGIAVTALASAACGVERGPAKTANDAPARVQLARAALVELPRTFEAGGVVRARQTAVVASRVTAPILAVHVKPGDRVARGAALITLDSRESGANDDRARAALAAATEAARAADAAGQAADAQLRLARATQARISELHAKRSATAQERDEAVAALSAAEAQAASAHAQAAAAVAAREAAGAAREAARVGLSYALLTAPFGGIVIERAVDPGSMASPGMPLVTLEDPGLYRLEVQVDEARAQLIAVDQVAQCQVSGNPEAPAADVDQASAPATERTGGQWRDCRVEEVGRVDPQSHSFLVKVDVPAIPGLRSGSFGRVRFKAAARRVLAVPAEAILRRGQLTMVFVVDEQQRARLRPVSVGAEGNRMVEILAGLTPEAVVVVEPPLVLADGTPVVQR